MTKQDIENKPAGRELNALIAECVLGWRWWTAIRDGRVINSTLFDGAFNPRDNELILTKPWAEWLPGRIEGVSQDMHLVQNFSGYQGSSDTLTKCLILLGCEVSIKHTAEDVIASVTLGEHTASSSAETASLAVCRAALLLTLMTTPIQRGTLLWQNGKAVFEPDASGQWLLYFKAHLTPRLNAIVPQGPDAWRA